MDDEPAIDSVLPAVEVGDVMSVRVAAEPVIRFEEGNVVGAGQQVGGGESGDSRSDHGHGRPPWAA